MKKLFLLLALLALAFAVALFVGCGQKSATEEGAKPAAEVATHDCAGDCGMKNVPADQLTEIDGKYYCAGCKDKAEAAHTHEQGDDGHGHG